MSRLFSVNLAISNPGFAASTRYDFVAGGDADEAVARAIVAAEAEFGHKGWMLDAVSEHAGNVERRLAEARRATALADDDTKAGA